MRQVLSAILAFAILLACGPVYAESIPRPTKDSGGTPSCTFAELGTSKCPANPGQTAYVTNSDTCNALSGTGPEYCRYKPTGWELWAVGGGGDVTGPGSAGAANIAVFFGTTGKIISDSLVPFNDVLLNTTHRGAPGHTVDTGPSPDCAGTSTYQDGEGGCDAASTINAGGIDQDGDGTLEMSCDGSECLADYDDDGSPDIIMGPSALRAVVDLAEPRTWTNPAGSCAEAIRDTFEPLFDVTGSPLHEGDVDIVGTCSGDTIADALNLGPSYAFFGYWPHDGSGYADTTNGANPPNWMGPTCGSSTDGCSIERANINIHYNATYKVDLSGMIASDRALIFLRGTQWFSGTKGYMSRGVNETGRFTIEVTGVPAADIARDSTPMHHDATLMFNDVANSGTPIYAIVSNQGYRRSATSSLQLITDRHVARYNGSIGIWNYLSWGFQLNNWIIGNVGLAGFVIGGSAGSTFAGPYWNNFNGGLFVGDVKHGDTVYPYANCISGCASFTALPRVNVPYGVIEGGPGQGSIKVFAGFLGVGDGFFTETKGTTQAPNAQTALVGFGEGYCDGISGDWHIAPSSDSCQGAVILPATRGPRTVNWSAIAADREDPLIAGMQLGDNWTVVNRSMLLHSGQLGSSSIYECANSVTLGFSTCDGIANTGWTATGDASTFGANHGNVIPLSNAVALGITKPGGTGAAGEASRTVARMDFSEATGNVIYTRLHVTQAVLDVLDNTGLYAIKIALGTDASNKMSWEICHPDDATASNCEDTLSATPGFNRLTLDWDLGTATGSPVQNNVVFEQIELTTRLAADTFISSERIIWDHIYADMETTSPFEASTLASGYVNFDGAEKTAVIGGIDYPGYTSASLQTTVFGSNDGISANRCGNVGSPNQPQLSCSTAATALTAAFRVGIPFKNRVFIDRLQCFLSAISGASGSNVLNHHPAVYDPVNPSASGFELMASGDSLTNWGSATPVAGDMGSKDVKVVHPQTNGYLSVRGNSIAAGITDADWQCALGWFPFPPWHP